MSERRNNSKKLYFILGIIAFVLGFFLFFENQTDSKISKHPKIVTMEVNQKNIEDALKEIKTQLKEIDRKMNRLLLDEYEP